MPTRDEEIQKGLNLVANLPDIMPDQVDEELSPIYESVQETLRVPIVNLIFRSLANYPEYLTTVWWEIQPVVSLQDFEEAADELRSLAVLERTSPGNIDLDEIGSMEKLRAFNDSIHYVLPKLLLIATALSEGQFGEIPAHEDLVDFPKMQTSLAPGSAKVSLLDPEEVSEQVNTLFKSVKDVHGHPIVSSYYRALGNWPDFLESAWTSIRPSIESKKFEEKKNDLIKEALARVRKLPSLVIPSTDLTPKRYEEVQKILKAFRFEFIPEMMIDVAQIKELLDGPDSARTSKMSLSKYSSEWDH